MELVVRWMTRGILAGRLLFRFGPCLWASSAAKFLDSIESPNRELYGLSVQPIKYKKE